MRSADAKIGAARSILASYWTLAGPDKMLRTKDLRSLGLKRDQIEDLLDGLPPRGVGGTSGQRIDECYRVLERMAGQ